MGDRRNLVVVGATLLGVRLGVRVWLGGRVRLDGGTAGPAT
ncbi:hypothetical protein [Micromonospora maris]|nr:hypothetical protein [Micromonospora maris]AEB45914.1 hypothetical protein VAB18032_24080 [Micromonospora maris AB-18-032]